MRKKTGGPNTPEGKLKVSQNALKHSLSTQKVTNISEQNSIDDYVQELIEFYDTKDPLEVLQLQRIALYREKLSKAYQAEIAQVQLIQQDLQNQPRLVFEKMTYVSPVAKGMALEFLSEKEWVLPCALEPLQLEKICYEIESRTSALNSAEDFAQYLPTLTQYLKGYQSTRISKEDSLVHKLEAIFRRFEETFARGVNYREKIMLLVEKLIVSQQETQDARSNQPAEEDELDKYIRMQQEKNKGRRRSNPKMITSEAVNPPNTMPPKKVLDEQLQVFIRLRDFWQEAQLAYEQFARTQEWMMQSASMQAGETDLLRYQTTWERRLSAAIGELLELQKRSKKT